MVIEEALLSNSRKRRQAASRTSRRGHPTQAKPFQRHMRLAVFAAVAFLVAVVGAGLLFVKLGTGSPPGPPKAAILDQLSITQPNPDFAASATSLLEQAGYAVDYYPGEQVTVDLYRNLATLDYGLIVLRVHAAMSRVDRASGGGVTEMEFVCLFTGEPYKEDKYLEEQRKKLVGKARTDLDSTSSWFGIGPRFMKENMKGRFNRSIVVLMGCDGLRLPGTAQLFLDRGAEAVVGWTGDVSVTHTDAVTRHLLQKLLVERLSVGDAVAQTAAEFGPDPWSRAELKLLQDSR